ncbi:MAG: hypothetical protein IKS84_01360 [Lachnospiraceae bacterium]|nr:hypothetical protein [Lachnospiraceae bacterium]MBR6487267.1 hypothetical protein [Lachnospiraceae bacterium]
MANNKTGKRQDKKSGVRDTILNVVIVILTFILFITAAIFVGKTKPRVGTLYGPEPAERLIIMLQRGRYNELMQERYSNEMLGSTVEKYPAYTVPYAAADYYEAAIDYNGYIKAGDTAGAAGFKKIMDSSRAALGEYEYVADDIDALVAP